MTKLFYAPYVTRKKLFKRKTFSFAFEVLLSYPVGELKKLFKTKTLSFGFKVFYAPEGRIKLKSFFKENQKHNYNKTQ